jgi:hypothetical protein
MVISEPLSLYDEIIRHLDLAGVVTILIIIAKEYKVHIRLRDRMDQLWSDYCIKHNIKYNKITNGHD